MQTFHSQLKEFGEMMMVILNKATERHGTQICRRIDQYCRKGIVASFTVHQFFLRKKSYNCLQENKYTISASRDSCFKGELNIHIKPDAMDP